MSKAEKTLQTFLESAMKGTDSTLPEATQYAVGLSDAIYNMSAAVDGISDAIHIALWELYKACEGPGKSYPGEANTLEEFVKSRYDNTGLSSEAVDRLTRLTRIITHTLAYLQRHNVKYTDNDGNTVVIDPDDIIRGRMMWYLTNTVQIFANPQATNDMKNALAIEMVTGSRQSVRALLDRIQAILDPNNPTGDHLAAKPIARVQPMEDGSVEIHITGVPQAMARAIEMQLKGVVDWETASPDAD